jgi:hypothetical protein
MEPKEAEALLREKQGGLCVRYYQRADGTVMAQDCPEGTLRKLRRRLALALGLSFALLMGLFLWVRDPASERRQGWSVREQEPFRTIIDWLDPPPPTTTTVTMGVVCPPPMPAQELTPAPSQPDAPPD